VLPANAGGVGNNLVEMEWAVEVGQLPLAEIA
jgi:hypothetical protein